MLDVIPGLLVLPLPILWLLLLGVVLWRWKRLSRAAFAVATAVFVAISLPASGNFLMSSLKNGAPPYDGEGPRGAHAILVPTGGIFDDGTGRWWPTSLSARRLTLGLRHQERLGLPLIISGGSPKAGQPPEAETLAEHFGLRAPEVLVEPTARNSSETAAAVAAMLIDTPAPRVILVTSPSHITRMSAALRHHGIEVLVHLVLTDDHDRSHFADLSAHGRIEVGKIDRVALGIGRHQSRRSRPSATVASKSLQSSVSAAMAR